MKAGRLDRLCVFECVVSTSDGGGGSEDVWTEQFRQWCSVPPPRFLSTAERTDAGAVTGRVPLTLTTRASLQVQAVTEAWRVIVGGVHHNIRAVSLPERDKITMLIEKGVAT